MKEHIRNLDIDCTQPQTDIDPYQGSTDLTLPAEAPFTTTKALRSQSIDGPQIASISVISRHAPNLESSP